MKGLMYFILAVCFIIGSVSAFWWLAKDVPLEEQIEYVNMSEDPLVECDIQLYPNPSRGMVTITFENMDGEKQLSVINARGEIVYKNTYEGEYAELNLSNQIQGVYFVQVVSRNNSLVKKLILR